jgi:hypothetical protein
MSNEIEKNANGGSPVNTPGNTPPVEKTPPASPDPEKKTAEPEKKKAVPEEEKTDGTPNLSLNVDNRPKIIDTKGDVDISGVKLQRTKARDIFIGTGAASVRLFSKSMRAKLPRSTEDTEADRHIDDELVTGQFISVLKETRILVISAEPNSGKTATAIYLARQLRRCDSEIKHDITQVSPLDPTAQIDLTEVVQHDESFCHCVIFFKDFLKDQNRALCEFLKGLDQGVLDSLCRELKSRGAYLIFTTDDHFIEPITSQLQALRLCIPLPRLGPDKLGQALDSIMKEMQSTGQLTREQREQALSRGKTVPRIRRFVREYLPIVIEGTLTIEQAFDRMDQVSLWMKYLAADFEAWTVVFVLGLMQLVSSPQGVSWMEFQELYGALLDPIRKWTGTPEKYFSYRPERLSDDDLLAKARVVINTSTEGRDMAQFQDQAFLKALWPAFLNQTRRLMTSLLPVLRQLAEGENFSLRIHAARILGRIGEMDPVSITLPLVSEWAHADSVRRQATVGYLFQGVLHSRRELYISECLASLELMGQSDKTDEVWTAIAALKQIGILDLPLAMAKLKSIAESKLAVYLAHNDEIVSAIQEIEEEFEKSRPAQNEAVQLIAAHIFLRELGFALMRHSGPVFFAMQYSLVALCLAKGPIEVFTELRRWLRGNEGLRSLVCLLYLQSDGIADELSGFIMTKEEETNAEKHSNAEAASGKGKVLRSEKNRARANPIVAALTQASDAPERFVQFLEDIFANFNTVFRQGRTNYLRDAFFNHLQSCVVETSEFSRGLKALEDVFVRLITSPLAELKMQTMDMFQTDVFLKEGSREEEFAINVKRRGLSGAAGRGAAKNRLATAKM